MNDARFEELIKNSHTAICRFCACVRHTATVLSPVHKDVDIQQRFMSSSRISAMPVFRTFHTRMTLNGSYTATQAVARKREMIRRRGRINGNRHARDLLLSGSSREKHSPSSDDQIESEQNPGKVSSLKKALWWNRRQ